MVGSYDVSKAAMFGLTKVLATELASDNIRVNCISPGLIKTRFSKFVSCEWLMMLHQFVSLSFYVHHSFGSKKELKTNLLNQFICKG